MDAFKSHRGILAPLDNANVDTDQIIAKQFLKSIKRTGFGEHLFHDWRTLPDGTPDPNFSLNQPAYKKASILVARNNFGCGSSREHAVWAVQQYGFKVIIAPSRNDGESIIPGFADIFANNSTKNGLLTVELTAAEVERLFQAMAATPGVEASVDLEAQKITVHSPSELAFSFQTDKAVKERLLHGLDDIGISLKEKSAIDAFEKKHATQISQPS